jgi:hypothetical protein
VRESSKYGGFENIRSNRSFSDRDSEYWSRDILYAFRYSDQAELEKFNAASVAEGSSISIAFIIGC